MALSQSALSELLDAIRAGGSADVMRRPGADDGELIDHARG